MATNYKESRDVQVRPGHKPNRPRHDTRPKGQKRRRNTKIDFGHPIISMLPIDSG
jgi:hypothetical protein